MGNLRFEYDIEKSMAVMSEGDRSVGISYPGMRDDVSPSVKDGTFLMKNVWDGVDVQHSLFGSSLHVAFIMNSGDGVTLGLDFSPAVTLRQGGSGVVVMVDAEGVEIGSLVFGEMIDDTGMSGRTPQVHVSGSGTDWRITVDGAGDWISSESRVRPIKIPISLAFSVPTADVASLARIMETEGEAELYRDTRPDSAIQFYVEFYDDEQFRRPRGKKSGMSVCSTVPFGVGDIWDFDEEDATRWEEGDGYEARTVYLQFIASKEVPLGSTVYYDVVLPGSVKYFHKVAEPTDMLVDGLPVFKGSFVMKRNAPPAFADGVGYIDVYVPEARTKQLPMSLQVIGTNDQMRLPITLEVTEGTRGAIGLGITLEVHELGRKPLPITVLVDQQRGSSVEPLEVGLEVISLDALAQDTLLSETFADFSRFVWVYV